MSIRIVVDSACDMTIEEAKAIGVDLMHLRVLFGEEEFEDGLNITHQEFFEKLVEGDVFPTTSQMTPYDYEQKFEEMVAAGDQVLCITMSSKLSGCYQSACIAQGDYEDSVIVVDSENVCIGQRIIVEQAARLRDQGCTLQEIADALEKQKKQVRLIALLDTLEYLKKGGRISKSAAAAGQMLSIKPVIAIVDGEVAVLGKARGSKNGANKLHELIHQETEIDFERPHVVAYSGFSDQLLRKYLKDHEDLFEGSLEDIRICDIGSAIGTHAGPGAIGVAFFVKED